MKKKKVYVSLPISGHDINCVKERAERAAQYLRDKDYEPVTPFDVSQDENASYAEHMGKDINALLDCDAVFFLRGWENSKGCQLERHAAIIYDKEMMHDASIGCDDFQRVLPYPPFMQGEVVTYNDCLSTKAVYMGTLPEKNDSGDDCFKSLVAHTNEKVYHGHLVFAKDIRLAKPREIFAFIYNSETDMISLKAKPNDYGNRIVAFLKTGVASEKELAENPKAYECGNFDCAHRTCPLKPHDFTQCKLKECKGRTPYTPVDGNLSIDVASQKRDSDIGSVPFNPQDMQGYVLGFDPAKENEKEG
ncbi:MAG: DUF4406 domain-containing protein [Phocaeicola sp.]